MDSEYFSWWGGNEGPRVGNGHNDISYSEVENRQEGPWVVATHEDNLKTDLWFLWLLAESLRIVGACDKRSRTE